MGFKGVLENVSGILEAPSGFKGVSWGFRCVTRYFRGCREFPAMIYGSQKIVVTFLEIPGASLQSNENPSEALLKFPKKP